MGTPIIEQVLQQGMAPANSFLFTLRDTQIGYGHTGDVWAGPLHSVAGRGLMAGPTHTRSTHPRVQRSKVLNKKVKDYRIMENISGISTSKSVRTTRNHSKSTLQYTDIGGINSTQYFGAPMYSRLLNNQVVMAIPFNLELFMKDNLDLYHLLANVNTRMAATVIEDVKIYRRRVQSRGDSNKLTPSKGNIGKACYRTPPTLIGTLKGGKVYFSRLPGGVKNIQHLCVKDAYMADADQSHFEYSIEIEILDLTKLAIYYAEGQLQDALGEYESYMLAFLNNNKRGYDYHTFANANAERLSAHAGWKSLIKEFVATLVYIYGPQKIKTAVWIRRLVPFAHPYTATPESLLMLKQLVDDFLSRLQGACRPPVLGGDETPFRLHQNIDKTSAMSRVLRLSHTLQARYFNELSPQTGFDYLGERVESMGASTGEGSSMPRISYNNYIERFNLEMAKYDIPSPSQVGINKYGWMSPRRIKTPPQDIIIDGAPAFHECYDLYQANVFPATTTKNFIGSPNVEGARYAQMSKILNAEGVSYSKLQKPLPQIAVEATSTPLSFMDSSLYFGDESSFVTDNLGPAEASEGSDTPAYRRSLDNWAAVLDNPMIATAIENSISSHLPIIYRDIELIKGSFAYAQLKYNPTSVATMNLFDLNINFNSIMQIEYLHGYIDGTTSATWTILTADRFSTAKASAVPLFCRLRAPSTLFNQENKFKLAPFNEYFVLGKTDMIRWSGLRSPSYVEKYTNMRLSVANVMNSATLGIGSKKDLCFSQYVVSSEMIMGGTTPTPMYSQDLIPGQPRPGPVSVPAAVAAAVQRDMSGRAPSAATTPKASPGSTGTGGTGGGY